MELKVTVVGGDALARRFKHAGADARPAIRHEVNTALFKLAALMKANIRKNFRRRTGGLEHIVIEPVVESAGLIAGRVGSAMPYARIHEFGGTVHARNVQNLTIPMSAMLTARGVARGTARDVISNPGSYGYDSTFFRKGMIFGKSGDSYSPLFLLKPSVDIPERPYARPAIEEVRPIFEAGIRSVFTRLFEAA